MTIELREHSAHAPERELQAMHALVERANDARYGVGTYRMTPEEFVASGASTASERVVRVGAWSRRAASEGSSGVLEAMLTMYLPLLESAHTGDAALTIDPAIPDARRRELAELLTVEAERRLAEAGRTTIMGGSPAAATGEVMAATGFGGADPRHPEAAPLVARGYALEQVYRVSVARLDDLTDLDERMRAASERSVGYDVVAWSGETPAQHREPMRALHERMSTDAPVGGLELEPEAWSDERLADFERSKQAGGRLLMTVAARDTASGELAGFSTIIVPSVADVAKQHDTLVAREHRGHGLGMLLKLANLVRIRDEHPRIRRVSTFNAEENRHMLSVNEATGFAPVAYEAVWQRRIPA